MIATGTSARCAAVWSALTVAAVAVVGVALPEVLSAYEALTGPGLSAQPFDRLLVWLAATAALGGAAWLWFVTTLVVLEAVGQIGRPVPGVPAAVRRALLSACGVAVAGGLAVAAPGAAGATPGGLHLDHGGPGRASVVLTGLPLPDRVAGTAVPGGGRLDRGPLPHPPPPTDAAAVVVRSGDTLWDIARRELGPGASDADVTARWHRIYELNRDLIGPDPDLIRPAQRLRTPEE